uniref:Uncharacterized protein n=1 Tax=Oryzias latipes TaxID=8090 RepID=A0A3P9L873_ORYLA
MSAFSVFASLPEDQFLCSICLDIFTDPVTTPCGHNFCRTCLSQHWDDNELCHCPRCNKRFPSRPDFCTNTIISEISVQVKRRKLEVMEDEGKPWRVMCDICTHKSQEKMQAIVGKLQEEITELQRKDTQLQELSQNQDSLRMLQSLQTISDQTDCSQIRVYSDLCVQTVRRAVSHIMDVFGAELRTLTNIELSRLRQYKELVTFDPSTAGGNLVVSDFGKRLKHPKIIYSSSSDDTERFHLPMILGTKGFSSGRHYWEVQVGMRNIWDVGVAAETADRSGRAALKKENGFFAIGKRGFDYQVHGTPYKVLHLCPRPRNLGVYLDYEEGRVSFYDVGEKQHIHSFLGVEFTGKLFPYFYLYRCKQDDGSLPL